MAKGIPKSLLNALLLASVGRFVGAASPGNVTFNNDNRYLFDVDGNHISAYALKIYNFEDRYYAYGLDFTSGTGLDRSLVSWSSVDLVNWKSEGVLSEMAGGRPHVIFNPTSQEYVLWSNPEGRYDVTTSSTPNSPFSPDKVVPALDPQFSGLQPADLSVTSFGDQAYLIWSALNFRDPRAGSLWPPLFQTLHVSPLTADFFNTTQTSTNVTSAGFDLIDQQAETPDLFVRNGIYYIVASNTCGFCAGSIGLVYRSASLDGPWERDIISAYTCGSQIEGVLSLTDPLTNETTFVLHATSVPGGPRISFSGHFFQPLRFNDDGSVQDLDCTPGAQFTVPLALGAGEPDSGALTSATDMSPRFADYSPVCDTDTFQSVYQTWISSKAGTLNSVSVNLAAGGQTTGIMVKVFRFSSVADLQAPSYKFEELGSATFNSSEIGTSFKAMSISTNTTVAQGDLLGFYIADPAAASAEGSLNLIPYCHLEYNIGANNGSETPAGQLAFEQAAGQNSFRGLDGTTSSVQQRTGKGIKFFATVI
ncbi:glycosyl hydrolase family 43 protein [Diaporthe helianthi]|uniref:Glycosyl hydrolase family 43 protein n=1 Tax=Diaporthe helianthi TaxID=158607 RepID=A0A2P5IAA6_DIAHE|nr:glycosyl hydrolase family 43 protein [Diaporthe helianthi]